MVSEYLVIIVVTSDCGVFSRMATQTEFPPIPPTAQVVGNAFVDQYYHILHLSPELVHRFYQESSVLSRAEPNGVMALVTTLKVSLLGLKIDFCLSY